DLSLGERHEDASAPGLGCERHRLGVTQEVLVWWARPPRRRSPRRRDSQHNRPPGHSPIAGAPRGSERRSVAVPPRLWCFRDEHAEVRKLYVRRARLDCERQAEDIGLSGQSTGASAAAAYGREN